jgi:hypothetical protein
MPIDPFRDYTLQEQRDLDLLQLFDNGIRGDDGRMTPELQGVGTVAMAIQALDHGVTVDMLGRIAYAADKATLDSIRKYPEDLTEELDKRGHGNIADVIRVGMSHIHTQEDGKAFARWLSLVHQMAKRRAADAPKDEP